MRRIYPSLLIAMLLSSTIFAQGTSFNTQHFPEIKKLATINFSEIDDPYNVNLLHVEAPNVSGNKNKQRLADIKEKIATDLPKNNNPIITNRGDADPPVIEKSFAANSSSTGIPLDNHLAMAGEQILTAINSHIEVKDKEGNKLGGWSLSNLASSLGLTGNMFDPRLLYDTDSDRFIAVFLHGSMSTQTDIIVAFSTSNDATGEWNLYSLPGNPNMNTTWTDYPMININQTDLIITGNLIFDGEPWQTGFDETVLWQIEKSTGYAGANLNTKLWDDIRYNGQSIRNLCPVESADEILEANCYFLSNRNFSVENDTIFIVELTGGINDTNTTLTVDVSLSDVNYGVPPNAEQEVGELQTNDARVLEGFYHNNEIQFVGNTRNLTNNKAGIYHGHVTNVSGTKDVILEHIIGDDYEIGYPGIIYTGDGNDEMDAIINFNHTSATRYAGMSAMYYMPSMGYSDIIEIKEGEGFIQLIGGNLQRWGDYSGSQTDFELGERGWISGFYGWTNNSNFPWMARLARPQATADINDQILPDVKVNVFPNPVADRFTIDFDIPTQARTIQVQLFDQQGKLLSNLLDSELSKTGASKFSFDISSLSMGVYLVKIMTDQQLVATRQLVRQ